MKVVVAARDAWNLHNFRTGIIRALIERGNEVITAGASVEGFESKVKNMGVSFVPINISMKSIHPFADLKLFWQFYHLYRREKPDMVHHFTIKPVIYGNLAARLAGVPRIINTITGLGYVFTGDERIWLRRLVERLYRLAMQQANFTLFQNEDDRNFFVHKGFVTIERTGLVPGSGVNIDHFSPVYKGNSTGGDSSHVTFLMVSRLIWDKGIGEYIEAARQVKADRPDIMFFILGGRDDRNPSAVPLRDINQWQDEVVVCYLGEGVDIRAHIAGADVVVLPSYREGIPRSLLEAAAMGKPVISTDVVGCREVVDNGKTGLLVPVKDPDALARAMIYMIDNPKMRIRMGKAGREKIENEFDERIVIEKCLEVYRQHVVE